MRLPSDGSGDATPEVAASLRLTGALLEGADSIDPEDLRRVARALGEPDDDVRAAAEEALISLGQAAAGELVATAAWGRRRARDRAAALLADLAVTPANLDRLIDAELDALDQTHAAIAVLVEPGDELLGRRLDERLRENRAPVLLLVAARRRSPRSPVPRRRGVTRAVASSALALAVIEAALPHALVARLVDAVDDRRRGSRRRTRARGDRSACARSRDRTELAGRDRLSRARLHTIGAAGRSVHRDTIASAAQAEALAASASCSVASAGQSPVEPAVKEEEATDMPSRVETLIALGRVPLLASLTAAARRCRGARGRSTSAQAA
ncbi:MAG: hypothetical protein WKG01_34350 [Kofleriaceae bacterium]